MFLFLHRFQADRIGNEMSVCAEFSNVSRQEAMIGNSSG